MGYDSKTGIITAPVSVADVSLCLGENSLDVATLCTSGRINPAALFRPRYTSARPDLELNTAGFNYLATQTSNHPTGNYTCPAYGVWVPNLALNNLSQNNQNAYNALFTAARNPWHIAVPDANSFKCLHHFVGYDHGARITKPVVTAVVSNRTAGGHTVTVMLTAPAPDGKTLSVSNLFGSKGLYFGVAVFRGTDKSGWMPSDRLFVSGATTPVSGTGATTVTLTVEDAEADRTVEYVYRVIPFVCGKPGVTASTLTDMVSYGIRIDDTCQPWMELHTAGVSSGTSPGYNYLLWADVSSRTLYPVPGEDIAVPAMSLVGIAYEATWWRSQTSHSALREVFYRIDFEFTCYHRQTGERFVDTYTWTPSGQTMGNGTILRDTRFDYTIGREDLMLFHINNFAPWASGSAYEVSDLLVRFYYYDSYGNPVFDDVFATFVPDAS